MKKKILDLINKKFNLNLEDIKLTNPPKKEMGDLSFNCGILARELKENPVLIARELIGDLEKLDGVKKVVQEGAFINLTVNKNIFTKEFLDFIENFQISKIENSKNKTVVIDYIGANVGKPMHIGHMCTPNQGQAIINLYKKLGYNVISDSHIGDWGIIFGKLILAYKLWGDENKLKQDAVEHLLELYIKITAETEKNPELEEQIRQEFKKLSSGDKESIKFWESFTKQSIKAMNVLLERMNVKPMYNIGESFYEGLNLPKMEDYPDLEYSMKDIVKELIDKKIATKNEDNSIGVVFDEESKIPSCILQKRDGTHGYLASDLAAVKYRVLNWNPDEIIYFVDSRQQLHLKQVFEISHKAGWLKPHPNPLLGEERGQEVQLFHAYNGFISLKDGAMSTRKGRIIKLKALLDESEDRAKKIILEKRDDIKGKELEKLAKIIGIGAIKYGYLKKNRETDVIFDWDEFMSFEGNSGPYIAYSYVRALNILKKNDYFDFKNLDNNVYFENEKEIALAKELTKFKEVLLETKNKKMPHILANYAYELTKLFNSFYNEVNVSETKDLKLKNLRLALVLEFFKIIKEIFDILAIDLPEKM